MNEDSGYDTVHPQDIFSSAEIPTVQVLLAWIGQGAIRETLEPVDFATEIYPIVQATNCGVCHYAGNAEVSGATQNGFPSYYDGTAMEVWTNLTGDGNDITCDGSNTYRVCVNDPDSSLVLQNLIVGNSAGHLGFYNTVEEDAPALVRRWILEGATFTP